MAHTSWKDLPPLEIPEAERCYCRHCGAPMYKEAIVCPHCGVGKDQNPNYRPYVLLEKERMEKLPTKQKENLPRHEKTIWKLIVGILLALVGFYFLLISTPVMVALMASGGALILWWIWDYDHRECD